MPQHYMLGSLEGSGYPFAKNPHCGMRTFAHKPHFFRAKPHEKAVVLPTSSPALPALPVHFAIRYDCVRGQPAP